MSRHFKSQAKSAESFRFSRTGEGTRKGVTVGFQEQALKVRSKTEAAFRRQFPLHLQTINMQESAHLLTFTFFLPSLGVQMCNIEGRHHPCTQLLKKTLHTCTKEVKNRRRSKSNHSQVQAVSVQKGNGKHHMLRGGFCLCSTTFTYRQSFQNFYCQQLCMEIVQISIKSTSC